MLLALAQWLQNDASFLRVFTYLTFRAVGATITALFVGLVCGPWVIRKLTSLKVGQAVRTNGPQTHLVKSGTPTMGGVLILLALVGSTLLWADLANPYVWIVLGVTVGFGAIGFGDDYLKLTRRNSKGLPGRLKLAGQLAIAAIAGLLFIHLAPAPLDTTLAVPFLKDLLVPLGWFFLPFAMVVMVGASNAVNLTDGLDGLAIGPTIVSALTFLLLAYLAGLVIKGFNVADYLLIPHIEGASELAVFCAAMAGAGISFLWFNTYPASVFMGDVGALAIGGGLGVLAVLTKNEVDSAIIHGVFFVEALSVMIQVFWFKRTGRRIFRMAPLHHHFELQGWAEPKIIVRFWIVSIMLALVGLLSIKLR